MLRGKAGIINIRLNKHGTDMTVSVLCKACHAIRTCIKVFVMSLDTFKERGEIIV